MQKAAGRKENKVLDVAKYLILGSYTIAILFPLYFLVVSSLKNDNEIFLNPFGLPKNFLWENYREVFINFKLFINMLNSLYYAFFGVLLVVIVGVLASYAIVRMRWKLSNKVFALLMTGMLVPMHSVILPLYLSVRRAGITSPRIVLALIFAAFALPRTIFILSGFLKDLPRTIEEAAVIDGASLIRIVVSIVIPMLKPAIATICIFNFLTIWNDLLIGLVFITKDIDKTLQLGILKFKGDYVTMYNYVITAILIAIAPTITVYLIFQKRIISGITAGAVKG
ncbi:MAG: carbohydrate ABC transporter permease [Firmicutes bacterium]|nr:carbohydrate ABC transporter permease [Bacillota bacterium]